MISKESIKNLTVENIKKSNPKEYLLLMAHALRLGALYKAKFFMWIENNHYELIDQNDEELEHLIKEIAALHKKAVSVTEETGIDYMDNIFYSVLKESGLYEEADCISLSLCLLGYVSFKSNLITNEEYLEIRDLLVPYKLMISQCKTKSSNLNKIYLKNIDSYDKKVMLLSKLGKGIESDLPDASIIKEAFEEITYDEKSWEKE